MLRRGYTIFGAWVFFFGLGIRIFDINQEVDEEKNEGEKEGEGRRKEEKSKVGGSKGGPAYWPESCLSCLPLLLLMECTSHTSPPPPPPLLLITSPNNLLVASNFSQTYTPIFLLISTFSPCFYFSSPHHQPWRAHPFV